MSRTADAPDRELAVASVAGLERIREQTPRVHCLTNTVAQSFTANMLLAAGAIPAMSTALDEIDDMVAGSGALLVNLGTLDEARRAAMTRAIAVAAQHRIPWVMDPVMVDRAPARLEFARTLLSQHPAAVRGNANEIAVLANDISATVVAETGSVDVVRDASRIVRLSGGHPLMARVTGLGCGASALVAAFCAVEEDPLQAAAYALLVLGRAAERAARTAAGPASFQIALLDTLYSFDAASLQETT